ncbi:hypothetical protein FXO37_10563 [Capsicum annuum]|nr:hypothetical protein FXO37_10563 [Capsicum annuum]
MKMIQFQDKKNHIVEVLAANDLKCNDLRSIYHDDTMVLINYIEEVVIFVISYRSINNKDPKYRNGKLFISFISLSHGLSVFQDGKSGCRDSLKMMANTESKVTRDYVDSVDELIQLLADEAILSDFLFPLWLVDKFGYASFFSQFVKLGIDPPKDVLCYGPPGTGKTLLARAVANRTDAYFIHIIGSEFVQKYIDGIQDLMIESGKTMKFNGPCLKL